MLAYAEYFGYQRVVVCLSSNYVGEKFSRRYAIDPVTGKELDIEINLEINPEEIPDIYAFKEADVDEAVRSLELLLAYWQKEGAQREIEAAGEDAMELAFSKCGIVPGDRLTDEKAAEVFRVAFENLTTFINNLGLSRTFSEEDLQKIVGKLQERG